MAISPGPADFWTSFSQGMTGPNGPINALNEDIAERRKFKLQMAMQSSAIEQEMQAKMAEQEAERRLSPGFGASFANNIGYDGVSPKTNKEAELLGTMRRSELNSETRLELARVRPRGRIMKVNRNGQETLVWVSPDKPNSMEGPGLDMGLSGSSMTQLVTARSSYEPIIQALENYEASLSRLATSPWYLKRVALGGEQALEAILKMDNPDAAEVSKMRSFLGVAVGKTINGGRPTKEDAAAVEQALANVGDSPAVQKRLMQGMREVVEGNYKSTYDTLVNGQIMDKEIQKRINSKVKHTPDAVRAKLKKLREGKQGTK